MTDEAHDLRAAGCAALLELMDAARAVRDSWDDINRSAGVNPTDLVDIVERLDILLSEMKPEPVWKEETWADVATYGPGARVRLGGVEAVVDMATAMTWHVDPRSPARSPRPLETRLVKVRLVGRERAYDMPASNTVEVLDLSWPGVTEGDWAAAALAAQGETAVRRLGEAFGARPVSVARTTDSQ